LEKLPESGFFFFNKENLGKRGRFFFSPVVLCGGPWKR